MNILFLTDNFPPESNAPASRTFEHASHWVTLGHQVTVITCAPNFPSGKVFDGYKNRWYQKEAMNGIQVIRVKTFITANEGFVKRTLDYVSFMLSATVAGILQRKPDVVIATSPQFFTAVAGFLVSRLKRRPFIFELRDLWPASITAVGAMKQSKVISFLERLELFLYRKAALIICVTHAFKEELIARDVPAQKISVVRNGVLLSQYRAREKSYLLLDAYDLHDKFVVGYIGTHGMAHGLPKLIEAAVLLESYSDIVFVFAGGGAERTALEDDVRKRALTNVRLIPMQPKSVMPELWSLCDIALIPLRNQALFKSVIPSKLFECMAMGIPVLMSMPTGEATGLVEETGCGLVVPPEDPDSLAQAIESLHQDGALVAQLSARALKAAPTFSRVQLAENMLKELEFVLSQ